MAQKQSVDGLDVKIIEDKGNDEFNDNNEETAEMETTFTPIKKLEGNGSTTLDIKAQQVTTKCLENCKDILTNEDNDSAGGLNANSTLEEISDDSNELLKRVAEVLEKIESLKMLTEVEVKKRMEEIKDLKSSNEDLFNKLETIETEFKDQMKAIESENNDLQSEVAAKKTEICDLKTTVVNKALEIQYLKSEKTRLNAMIDELNAQLVSVKGEKQNIEINTLETLYVDRS